MVLECGKLFLVSLNILFAANTRDLCYKKLLVHNLRENEAVVLFLLLVTSIQAFTNALAYNRI